MIRHWCAAAVLAMALGGALPAGACGTGDTFKGTPLADKYVGTAGPDHATLLAGDDLAAGGGGPDGLRGARGNDRLVGGGGADHLFGGAGQDRLVPGPGPDKVWGGPRNDTIQVAVDHEPDYVDCGRGDDLVVLVGEEDPLDTFVRCEGFIIVTP
jgi:Ca2+-binding RTX toxin-like protein